MNAALGIRLNLDATTDGVGFVNLHPLPDFPSGLQALHLLRRRGSVSAYNRVTLLRENLAIEGMDMRDDEIYSANASQGWSYDGPGFDAENFTFALAVRVRPISDSADRVILLRSSDYTGGGGRRGIRLFMQESNTFDVSLSGEAHLAGQRVSGPVEFDSPPPDKHILIFMSFDGSSLIMYAPGIKNETVSPIQVWEDAKAPDPNATLYFADQGVPGPSGSPSFVTDVGYAAFAQWNRGLSVSEIQAAHTAMQEWAAAFDLKLV